MEDDDWKGRTIDGRYTVESVLGKGGMGLVLKARHKFTGADVALKVLRPELQLDTEVQMRFLGEARAPSAIGHPGIVQVVDAGKAPDGLLYLVMELLQGRTLREAMARGQVTPPEIRRIMMELFDALAAAHVRGFVHRDLKPENVFLAGSAGTVKLLDFGIAKVLDAGLANVRTALGVTMGTPAYMAPEQVNNASGVDARADLWAAGVMIYEMLCGKLPFVGATTGAFLLALTTQEPTPIRAYLSTATPAHDAFFSRALARELFRRFPSAQEMAQAFMALALPLGLAQPATPVSGLGATVATGPGIKNNPTGVAGMGLDATHTPQHAAQMPGAAAPYLAGHSGQTPIPVAGQAPNPAAQPPMAFDTRAPQMPSPAHAAHAPFDTRAPQMPGPANPAHAPVDTRGPQMPGPAQPAHVPLDPRAPQMTGPAHGQQPATATSHPVGYAGGSTPAPGSTMPVAAAPRSNTGVIIGGLGGLALAAAIAIVLISRCEGGRDKSVAKQGSAATIDAAVVAVVADAAVAVPPPVDAAVVAVADAAPPPADARVRTPKRDAAVGTAPIDPYAGPVDAGVPKVVVKPSPCAPRGTASCIRAMKCQNSCEDDDDSCRCGCRATVDPAHAPELDAFAACAKDCGWANLCEVRKCGGKAAACARR